MLLLFQTPLPYPLPHGTVAVAVAVAVALLSLKLALLLKHAEMNRSKVPRPVLRSEDRISQGVVGHKLARGSPSFLFVFSPPRVGVVVEVLLRGTGLGRCALGRDLETGRERGKELFIDMLLRALALDGRDRDLGLRLQHAVGRGSEARAVRVARRGGHRGARRAAQAAVNSKVVDVGGKDSGRRGIP